MNAKIRNKQQQTSLIEAHSIINTTTCAVCKNRLSTNWQRCYKCNLDLEKELYSHDKNLELFKN